MNIGDALRVLHDDGDVVELRAIGQPVLSGYFKIGEDDEELAKWVAAYPNATFYQTMNKLSDAVYSRSQRKKIVAKPKSTSSDGDVEQLRWILIDCDPVRSSDTSSSDTEKADARQICRKVYKWLVGLGFSRPVVADSGNGYHLLFRIVANVDSAQLIKRFLAAVDAMCSTESVKIDTAVFNPARITKLYGTKATKGSDTPERPHRFSGIISVPERAEPTRLSLIQAVADMIPKEEPQRRYERNSGEHFDVKDFLQKHKVQYRELSFGGGRKFGLNQCPFNADHTGKDVAAVFEHNNGVLGFHCFHNGCSGKTWKDFRELFEPDAYSHEPRTNKYDYTADIERHFASDEQQELDFVDIADVVPVDRSKIQVIKSNLRGLDCLIGGFNKGQVTVWSGSNGSGKSTLLSQMVLQTVSQGYKVAMFSGELRDTRVKDWLYLQAAGEDGVMQNESGYWSLRNGMRERLDEQYRGKIFLYNNLNGLNWERVIGCIDDIVKEKSLDAVFIDNLMSLDYSQTRDRYEMQGKIVKALTQIAKNSNVHVHFVCHPKKPSSRTMLRKADVSGSMNITDLADNVMMVSRVNEDYRSAYAEQYKKAAPDCDNVIEVMKNRDLGVVDQFVYLYYSPSTKTFADVQKESKEYIVIDDDIPPWEE